MNIRPTRLGHLGALKGGLVVQDHEPLGSPVIPRLRGEGRDPGSVLTDKTLPPLRPTGVLLNRVNTPLMDDLFGDINLEVSAVSLLFHKLHKSVGLFSEKFNNTRYSLFVTFGVVSENHMRKI